MAPKLLSLFSEPPNYAVHVDPLHVQERPHVKTQVAVAPCKLLRGFRGDGEEEVRAGYVVREVSAALRRRYRTDAHLVTYVVEGASRQPRINKAGLAVFPGEVRVESFFCDVDNPGHATWDQASTRAALDQYDELEALHTAGMYFTRRGRRIVQPLACSLPVLDAERALSRWLASLEVAGLEVDWSCRDWTRHFRLPNVVRDGVVELAPVLLLDRMAPIYPELPDGAEARPSPPRPRASGIRLAEPRAPRYGSPQDAPSFAWTTTLDPSWMPALERIAQAVRQVETEWHSLFMAVAGAMLARGADPEALPLLCRAISMMTGADDRPDDRETAGRTTAEHSAMGLPVMGLSTLRRRWPLVAEAFAPAEPLRFRELVDLLQAAGGSRALAARAEMEREEVVRLLRGEAPTAVQTRALRLAIASVAPTTCRGQ